MNVTSKRIRILSVGVAVIVWLIATAGAAAAGAPKYRAPDHVLTVGVGEYRNLSDIPAAGNDPKLVSAVWPYAKETRLVNRAATVDGIKKAFGRLKDEVKPGGFSVIFLAGHGGRAAGAWSFAPHDFDPARPNLTQIHGGWIAGVVGELVDRGDRVLLIVDSCHAGELRSHLEHLLDGAKGELILFAAAVPSQSSIEAGANGLFATAVAEGLRGRADTDGDGNVTLKELRRYVAWRLRELLREHPELPGVAWDEQDALCDTSASVNDMLPLSVAREKKAARDLKGLRLDAERRVGRSDLLEPELDAFADRISKPVPEAGLGVWRTVINFDEPFEEITPDGNKRPVLKKFQDTIALRLEKGRYEIAYVRVLLPDVAGGRRTVLFSAVGSGACSYTELDGKKFLTLDYGNGVSGLTVEAWGERELKLKAPTPNAFTRYWPKDVWVLERR